MIDFVEYVVSELKSKRLSKNDALALIKQFSLKSPTGVSQNSIHPLLHFNTSDLSQQSYSTILTGDEFFLNDHQIGGQKILPAVVYLEMARAAIEEAIPDKPASNILELRNVVWIQPIVVSEHTQINIALLPNETKTGENANERIDFEIYSIDSDKEIMHCQGQAIFIQNPTVSKIDINQLKKEMRGGELKASVIYPIFKNMGANFGPAHRGIKTIFQGDKQALSQLFLPSATGSNKNEFILHPSLMDSAIQSSIGMYGNIDKLDPQPSLPFALASLRILSPCTEEMFAWVRYAKGSQLGDNLEKLDIDLCDKEGNICVQMGGYTSRVIDAKSKVSKEVKDNYGVLIATPEWKQAEIVNEKSIAFSEKHIVLYNLPIIKSEQFESLLSNTSCYSYTLTEKENISERFSKFTSYCFEKLQSIIKSKPQGKVLLQIAVPSLEEETILKGLTGFFQTVTIENPNILGQIIVIDEQKSIKKIAAQLVVEQSRLQDKVVKYKNDQRYIVNWNFIQSKKEGSEMPFKDNGVYVITGGLGGLGVLFAKEILKHTSTSKVILTGRSSLTDLKEKQTVLEELKTLGKGVEYCQLNLESLKEVTTFITSKQKEYHQLNGIIHSAGMTADNYILKKTSSEFSKVLQPKVTGTYNLDKACEFIDLDFFVLFSSVVSSLGNAGQSDYAAANGFMDEFAQYRNSLYANGKRSGKTLSINWPLWAEGGMKPNEATRKFLEQSAGMFPMSTANGMQAFYLGLELSYQQILVMEGDLSRLKSIFRTQKIELESSEKLPKQEKVENHKKTEIVSDDLFEKTLEYLCKQISKVLKLPVHKIDPEESLEKYGIDSILAMNLTNQLEKTFGSLPKTLFFEYLTIKELTGYFVQSNSDTLASLFNQNTSSESQVKPIEKSHTQKPKLITKKRLSRRFSSQVQINTPATNYASEPIAIVGLSGRYPEALNIEEYWNNLQAGKDCITEVPKERWDWREYYSEDRDKSGYHYSKWGGFIKGVDEFDPKFFNISPREAVYIDPQERLFLQHVWMAVEDAGYNRASLQMPSKNDLSGQVGVYAGVMYSEYQLFGVENSMRGNRMSIPGSYASIANRVSYVLNLHGPSMTLDTMCSSSLAAIHLACQDLKLGKTQLGIAGGVNVSIHPNKYLFLSSGQFVSTAGHCQSFGEGGDGYIPGEGVGVVILKRYSEAVRDGNQIYGIIKGSSLNHGGKTNGYSVPNPKAQTAVITKALTESGIKPRQVSYIEAHGTGTKLGDPIEIAAMSKAFQQDTSDKGFCLIGSAKSNVGHCESAAGMAGLTKVLLQMKYQKIVPSLHSKVLNPYIDFNSTPFIVNQKLRTWDRPVINGQEFPRVAGISAFGAGGANGHLIIQEYSPNSEINKQRIVINSSPEYIIPLSARTETQLKQKASDLLTFIKNVKQVQTQEDGITLSTKNINMASLAYTLKIGREALDERVGFIVSTIDELLEKLQAYCNDEQDIENVFQGQLDNNNGLLATMGRDADFKETVTKWIKANKLSKVLELWVNGLELDWNRFYGDVKPLRMSLPTYPFAKEKYWIELNKEPLTKESKEVLHPLLHTNTSDFHQQSFSTSFKESEFFLTDYQINTVNGIGQKMLSAMVLLEMAEAAIQKSATIQQRPSILELTNVEWGKPFIAKKDIDIKIELFKTAADKVDFEIFSQVDKKETVYCIGEASQIDQPSPVKIELAQLKEQMSSIHFGIDQLYTLFSEMGLNFSPSQQGIVSLIKGEQQLLAQLRLPNIVEDSLHEYALHPTFMDSILQASISLLSDFNLPKNYPYLPFSLSSLRVLAPCKTEMFAWVRYAVNGAFEDGQRMLDVDLCDTQGNVCIQLRGLLLQQLVVENQQKEVVKISQPRQQVVSLPSLSVKPKSIELSNINGLISEANTSNIIRKPQTIQLFQPLDLKELGVVASSKPVAITLTQEIANPIESYVTKKASNKTTIIGTTKEEILAQLKTSLANALYLSPSEINIKKSFVDLGLDSIIGVEWIKEINRNYGLNVSATKIYDYSTIVKLTAYIKQEIEKLPSSAKETVQISPPKKLKKSVVVADSKPVAITLVQDIVNPVKNIVVNKASDKVIIGTTKEEILAQLKISLANALYLSPSEININKSFVDLGLDSIIGVEWIKEINKNYGLNVSATKIYDYSTIVKLTVYVKQEIEKLPSSAKETVKLSPPKNLKESVVIADSKPTAITLMQEVVKPIEKTVTNKVSDSVALGITKEEILAQLKVSLANALYLSPTEININKSFVDLGLDSIIGVEWIKEINKNYGLNISATKIYDYSTIVKLTTYVKQEIAKLPDTARQSKPVVGLDNQSTVVIKELSEDFVENSTTNSNTNTSNNTNYTKDQVQEFLKSSLGEALFITPSEINSNKSFVDLGLDSIIGVEWVKIINKNLGLNVSATIVYDYSSIKKFASYLFKQLPKSEGTLSLSSVSKPVQIPNIQKPQVSIAQNGLQQLISFPVLKRKQRKITEKTGNYKTNNDKIAIVGMSGRYPQAKNVNEYWNNLSEGKNSVTEIPASRWDINKYYDPDPTKKGKMYCKWLGTLDDADQFDPLFFQITPAEAEYMDPQHRLFLQEGYKAFEDAGYSNASLSNKKCGVYMGIMSSDYSHHLSKSKSNSANITGNSFAIGAARIAYFLNLKGPAIPIDTACSSSLVSIHIACQGLLNHEIDMALTGGVGLYLIPEGYVGMCDAGMLSPDGQCKTFDNAANGFVPGEGVGALVLKRLEDAEKDNDHIYGVILGSGINQDGKTNGITAPSVNSQIELERDLYERYDIHPESISYVETHGTGTKLGDPIELEALATVFKEKTSKKNFCALGSVKSNIGHTSGAAGVASVQKVLLSMQHKTLVPTLNVVKENTIFDFKNSPFYISKEKQVWEAGSNGNLRRAAVSSFGFSGTNAHLVIEEYPNTTKKKQTEIVSNQNLGVIIPISAKTTEQLKQRCVDLLEFIRYKQQSIDLIDMGYTLQVGRDEMKERLSFIVYSIDDLEKKLDAYLSGNKSIQNTYQGQVVPDMDNDTLLNSNTNIQNIIDKCLQEKNWNILVELWVRGLQFDWTKLYTNNKPQRLNLPTYPFAKERYWVDIPDDDLHDNQVDTKEIETQKTKEVQESIQKLHYQFKWLLEEISEVTESNEKNRNGSILILNSSEEFSQLIKDKREENSSNNVLISVKIANTFKEVSPNTFTLNPEKEEHFDKLIDNLNAKNQLPREIIHQGYLPQQLENKNQLDKQLTDNYYTLFYLSKALMKVKITESIRIVSFFESKKNTNNSLNTAIGGFFKSLNLENSKFQAKIIEIQNTTKGKNISVADKVDIVLKEFKDNNWNRNEIRYEFQNNKQSTIRKVKVLEQFTTLENKIKALPIKQHGVYIVSGGIGGLGYIFSEYLVKNFQCKLVLFGRSALDATQQTKINHLKSYKSEVVYIQADASKLEDVEKVAAVAREQFKEINGVIHSAGVNNDSLILNKSKEEIEKVLAPKISGTINLDYATKNDKLDMFIMFSSIAGVFGNIGQCDYAYGNHFMDSFAESRENLIKTEKRFGKTCSINWPYWEEGGMFISKDELELAKKQSGICPLPTNIGIQFWEEFIQSERTQGMVLYGYPSKIKASIEQSSANDESKHLIESTTFNAEILHDTTADYLKNLIGKEIKLDPNRIDPRERFETFGIDSITINHINVTLEKDLGTLSKTLFYEYATIEELATHLVQNAKSTLIEFFNLEHTAKNLELETINEPVVQTHNKVQIKNDYDNSEPIAIIGLSGSFPQSENLNQYWENLKKGKDLVDLVPSDRWDYEAYYDQDPEKASEGKIYCKWGGFLNDVDKFDASFFKITAEEAKIMDPQERLFLQSVWASIEDAGYTKESLKKQHPKGKSADVGVYVGVTTNSYNLLGANDWSTGTTIPGGQPWSIANRISYFFDLQGASVPIDTACSSSLVAIHMACESLKKKECQVAVAGGVNLYLHPSKYHSMCKNRMIALNGKCRSFGTGDDGFVPGEGVGSILLKPLSKAIEDKDNIYAVIAGSAFDHSGRSNGYLSPNPNSQADLINKTLTNANINPETISYIEGHGTGTQLGDSLEIVALTNAFQKDTAKKQFCSLGSVKANIGHTEAAAGIAGVAKIIMQLKHRQLVPTIHSNEVNPNIEFKETPFYLQHKLSPWKPSSKHPRRALINSFGAGGVNACVILEEFEKTAKKEEIKNTGPYLIVLSAKNNERLKYYANQMLTFVGKNKHLNLENLCYTLQTGREAMQERLAIIVSDWGDLLNQLKKWREQKFSNQIYQGLVDVKRIGKRLSKNQEAVINTLVKNRNLVKLASMWIEGNEINWEGLYIENKPTKITVPTYPFTKERHWISEVNKSISSNGNGSLHPLISYNSSTLKEISFSSLLSENEFYALDHQVNGEKIFPGAGFLEMANISGNMASENKVGKIKDIVWIHPLSFKDGSLEVQTLLKPNGIGTDYQIISFDDEAEKIVHAEGKLIFKNDSNNKIIKDEKIPVKKLKEKCGKSKDGNHFYDLFMEAGFNYGPAFRTVQEFYVCESFALSKLKINKNLKDNFDQFILHPSLLDGALQTVAALIGELEPSTAYLPFAIDEIEIVRPLSTTCYAYVEFSNPDKKSQKDIKKFDIKLLNEEGNVLLKLNGFYARALGKITQK